MDNGSLSPVIAGKVIIVFQKISNCYKLHYKPASVYTKEPASLLKTNSIIMKKLLFFAFFVLVFSTVSFAQKFDGLDKSPMDMAYFPNNFAHDRKAGEKAVIRVTYSRPQKNGREIFGKLIPYGKVWRTGANEATEIKFYQDIELGGKKVKAGSYALSTIPGEKEWTIILNSDLDYWGAYSYNDKNDALRVTAPATQLNTVVENFTIQFDNKGDQQGVMKLAWDKTVVEVPLKL